MARKEETGEFRLDVPLDASGIEDFKPEQPVKVLALAGERALASQTVKRFSSPLSFPEKR